MSERSHAVVVLCPQQGWTVDGICQRDLEIELLLASVLKFEGCEKQVKSPDRLTSISSTMRSILDASLFASSASSRSSPYLKCVRGSQITTFRQYPLPVMLLLGGRCRVFSKVRSWRWSLGGFLLICRIGL